METSVKAAEVLDVMVATSSSSMDQENDGGQAAAPAACGSSPEFFDPMIEFSRRLDDIMHTYGSTADLLDKQDASEAETELTLEAPRNDTTVTMETDVSLLTQSLNKLSSSEEKLETLVRKYSELAALRRCDQNQLCDLQQKLSSLRAERRSSVTARSKLEALCRELQSHYNTLREETLQCRSEDEQKRKEITGHFQNTLTDIRAQIEQHSARNDRLCRENANLSDKLESLMGQCELRDESLEKIDRHRELQHKLTDAKLQEANALLAAAEEKHKREKEYLLREAIDKTKKCFAMKEQELTMKKKLALYAQKFDEFQATLAKSNEIYVRFKKEMDNMSGKMKKMEKESNLWKTRFENCNKALTDMIEERTEKGKQYELFVLKIDKLEKLCRILQEERKVLYEKIKDVRHTNSELPAKISAVAHPEETTCEDVADSSTALLTDADIQELQEKDPVLTEDMARLREEQAKLQEFAASLLATPTHKDEEEEEEVDPEEDGVASAFFHFNTKGQAKEGPVSVPTQVIDVKSEAADTDLPLPDHVEEVETSEEKSSKPKPEPEQVQTQVQVTEQEQGVKADEEKQQLLPSEAETLETPGEDKAVVQLDHDEVVKGSEEATTASESVTPSPETTAANTDDLNKKQAPKKKKKKSGKNSS
ncbi:beta-taxilin-like isoform X1 [Solea solea]|uniref:beta-taxilin-like isoform X1 n=1 Tax=Solea solea TaxID=90069 RepID=UPI00272A2558|nr:beta-taxilin-like isoform X1 [Solea solea]